MTDPIVFMFSGQGSQYYQMGRRLFDEHTVFRHRMERLDRIALEITGASVLEELYHKNHAPADTFDDLLVSNLALIMVQCALADVLEEMGIHPDYVLGASLGEIVAATTAGMMDVNDTLQGAAELAQAVQRHCAPGAMTAVVHDWHLYFDEPLLHDRSELAARNYPSHFVLAGEARALSEVEKLLHNREVIYQHLPVRYGFHSALLEPARNALIRFFRAVTLAPPRFRYISCVDAAELEQIRRDYFWDTFRQPIEFQKAIDCLAARHPCTFIDLGPAATLTNFVKYNLGKHTAGKLFPILTPFETGMRNLARIDEHFGHRRPTVARHPDPTTERHDNYHHEKKDEVMNTWLFPGQGSQHKGMGETLFDRFEAITSRADAVLGYSIKELCVEDPRRELKITSFTQPALYVVNALSWYDYREQNPVPDYLAGHSLGEYNALLAAGVFDFETGLRLVQKRSELMHHAAGGAMAAVINTDEAKIVDLLQTSGLANIDIANYNAPSQIVISGLASEIQEAVDIFTRHRIIAIRLNVSGAFHSRFMQAARDEFESFLQAFQFNEPSVPVIANVHARPYAPGTIAANLADQITQAVQWTDTIRFLMGQGEMNFKELGPGRVLTDLAKRIQKEARPWTPAERPPDGKNDENGPEPISPPADNDAPVPDSHFKPAAATSRPSSETDNVPVMFSPISPESLGNKDFKRLFGLEYAYLTGSMVRGIASKEMVVRMGKSGMLGFLGTGGMSPDQIQSDIDFIQSQLADNRAYGLNLLSNINDLQQEERVVDLFLKNGIHTVEASAFMQISPALARYRLTGISLNGSGGLNATHRIIAKLSRPEVAELFLSPPPEQLVSKLLRNGQISREQAQLAGKLPMADAICVEADSGGHTDRGNLNVLLPTILRVRDEQVKKHGYSSTVYVGAAGGIGTPEAAAAAFVLGADFILTGSINQCSVEACISESAKNILQSLNVQDTDYAPAADMFEFGAKVQVVRKGVFFPSRANKLFDLYRNCNSWEDIDAKTRHQLEERYFKRSFDEIYADTKSHFLKVNPEEIERAEKNPKHKMALVFRWYLFNSMQLALIGDETQKVDYQIHCGPSLGAFNQWVKGTLLEDWRNRHVDEIAGKLLTATADFLNARLPAFWA